MSDLTVISVCNACGGILPVLQVLHTESCTLKAAQLLTHTKLLSQQPGASKAGSPHWDQFPALLADFALPRPCPSRAHHCISEVSCSLLVNVNMRSVYFPHLHTLK